jgi:hypothetical protein
LARSPQEKANDKQAEVDALRAQRTQEAYEREWRAKEKAEAERVRRLNQELSEAREQQKVLKMKQLADHAQAEQAEFYRIIAAQRGKDLDWRAGTGSAFFKLQCRFDKSLQCSSSCCGFGSILFLDSAYACFSKQGQHLEKKVLNPYHESLIQSVLYLQRCSCRGSA